MTDGPLLSVSGLTTVFHAEAGTVRAVDGVSFSVDAGETVCLVGESGSGKTVAVESITRLFDSPRAAVVGGSVEFDGTELTARGGAELRSFRGARIGHVFQGAGDALNPVYRVGTQVAEAVRLHADVGRREARRRAVELLDRVGLPDPAARADSYPHELSGGMAQRVSVAIALAGDPDLLVADEPTTGLDVTIQHELLRLLADLQAELGLSVLFVTHDLGVVADIADRVVVMYAGKVMERGPVEAIFESPGHPYTRALLACLPGRGRPMRTIEGELPSATHPPPGCRFAGRCPHAVDDCREGGQPALLPVDGSPDQRAACLFHGAGYDRQHIEGAGVGEGAEADKKETGGAESGEGARGDASEGGTGGEGAGPSNTGAESAGEDDGTGGGRRD